MKEFMKNLLILLSTPLYMLLMTMLFIVAIGFKAGEVMSNGINKWINFMKDDYKKIYEVIKNGSKQR